MVKSLFLAAALCIPGLVIAQDAANSAPRNDDGQYGPGPNLFLGCSRGAWSLNGNQGAVLHEHSGLVEHWKLVKDFATPNFYYYHEKSLDGSVDWRQFRWRFYRYYDPCGPCLEVYRKYPGEDWTYICCASLTQLPPNAMTTKESRANAMTPEQR